jgi:hypothetical protein
MAVSRLQFRRHALWSSLAIVKDASRHFWIVALLSTLAAGAGPAWGSHARVSWLPVSGAAGYKLYVRSAGQPYGPGIDVGAVAPSPDGVIRYVTSGPPLNVPYYFAVTRYNNAKVESAISKEVTLTIVGAPITAQAADSTGGASDSAGNGTNSSGPSLDRPPQLPGESLPGSGAEGPAPLNTAIGDVVSCAPGNEVVLGDDGSRRRASLVRVFSGGDPPRLLLQFRAFRSSIAGRGPLAFAVGNVLPDTDHPGDEIVVGDRAGWMYVFGLRPRSAANSACQVEVTLQRRFPAFPDVQGAVAYALGVGDAVPDHPGDEIVVADDGTLQAGLVRILDGDSGVPVLEFDAFGAEPTPANVTLWVGDAIPALPGAEVIVGQGKSDTPLRVFSIVHGVPLHVLDVPDLLSVAKSVWLESSGM